jgi:hypothetical protein
MGSIVKKVTKPFQKLSKKIIPKEIRPALPYIAAAFGPAGLAGTQFATLNPAFQKALIAGATAAATDDDANILRTAVLAGAPDALSQGLGSAGRALGNANPESKLAQFLVSKGTGLEATLNNPGLNMDTAKILGTQTAIDSAAKFAELNQAEIDKYNQSLLSQGLKDKGARRNAIYNIYINAGYEPDYVNGVLDRYGYAKGGEVGGVMKATAASMSLKDFAREIREKQKKKKEKKASGGRIGFNKGGRAEIITGLLNIKDADGNLIYSYEDAVDKANELLPDEVKSEDLQSAVGGLEAAFGRPFGNIEPVPMMRFARGGEVEIEEQVDDLNIMDFMKDQGVEYGEQASNIQNDEILQNLYEEFLDLGFSPEDAAKKARQAFDEMSQGPNEGIMQMASGYKTDIEDMYEQYVFEMTEQGVQPMSFSEFLAQAEAGMASGGKVKKPFSSKVVDFLGGPAALEAELGLSGLLEVYNVLGMPLMKNGGRVNMAGGGKISALMELGKAGLEGSMKGMSKLKNMVVNRLSRMTDDVELRGSSDYAEDTGASFELQVTAKSKKGKKTLDSLVEEGVVEKLDDNTYFISDANTDAISGMKGLKASGMLDEGAETFTRFDQGAGMGPYDTPYYGYDEVIDTFSKKAEGGIMNRNLLNTGMDKDMRGGGFIPEGTKEKADDVPARLSKNEFVMTADAVRAAGGGSVNEGAKRMYETMHKLEAKV